ncbi:hypothetical protein CGRA01v4_02091 [Colletotrichum graminicola]|nr:hypothetical protein CGRA01v4_02091 [Colletotrichum graminicola]
MSAAPSRPGTLQLSPAMSQKPTVPALSSYILQSQPPKTTARLWRCTRAGVSTCHIRRQPR